MCAQPLDTPLWRFSLFVYDSDGVAGECLALQERLGLDINVLLLAAFAGAVEGAQLEVSDIAAASAAVADWQSGVVRPLRQARRALKPAATDTDDPLSAAGATLRGQVKVAELEAEKIEQTMLWQWSRRRLAGRARGDRAFADNLRAVLEFYGATDRAEAALPHLLAATAAYRP